MTRTANQLQACRNALAANGFDAFIARDSAHASALFFEGILPQLKVRTLAWGDSMTMAATGVLDELSRHKGVQVIATFEPGIERKVLIERRRQALLTDLFLTGANAVTLDGKLVNLDMIGNRTAPLSFGPKKVVIFAGRNKIVPDIPAGMERVRTIAAPLNSRRHGMQTPCVRTGRCHDCSSPQRICNSWSLIEKCFPKGRIKIVLIDEDLGL
jgi:hypothetical protein